jgi:cell filamentation protein, protein adenylyltransferase
MRTDGWTYLTTHPWITFSVDLRAAPTSLWMNLGEARSKFEHIAGVPLRPDVAKRLHTIYLVKGVLGTTAIEGNTLTEKQVLQHLQGELKLPPSQAYLQQEIDNIIAACNGIAQDLWTGSPSALTLDKIKQFNSLVLKKLPLAPGVVPGEIRMTSVGVGPYLGAPAGDCEYLTSRLCDWLSGSDFDCAEKDAMIYGIIKSMLAHLYLAWIHPFGDGNGRTARLMEFQILTAAGAPSPAAHLLSNHYNLTRTEYYRQLDLASKSNGNIIPFLQYAVQGLVDGLTVQLQAIRNFQWDITWRNFVHETFGGRDKMSPSEVRQHHLALDLSQLDDPIVPVDKIREISPRMIASYSKKSGKTLRRDINKLKKLDLVEETSKGVKAKSDKILAFLPGRAPRKIAKITKS